MGKPIPKGSQRVFHDRDGRAYTTSDNRDLAAWERQVHLLARNGMGRRPTSLRPVEAILEFVIPTPKKREGELWPFQFGTGDLDKLIRATLDGLTGTVFKDDAQVVKITSSKRYSSPTRLTGVEVWVYEIPDP